MSPTFEDFTKQLVSSLPRGEGRRPLESSEHCDGL